jgi:flagellar biosynthesis anti-sigma factor FlgM
MVNRITDSGTLPSQPARPGGTGSATGASTESPANPASAPAPAVRIQLSATSQVDSAAAASPAVSDEALVREIRQRVEAGQFRIDYEQVGEGILRDLLSQSLYRTKP